MTTSAEQKYDRDVLGQHFESTVLPLPDDALGPVRATLVRRLSTTSRPIAGDRRAVLYVHGFADYFFHTELAEFHAGRGNDFYALDLRRYGRSLMPGQTPYDIADIADYRHELDAAVEIILAEGHERVTVMAHSTGGLITPLWLAARARSRPHDPEPVDALVLNSPFLEINTSTLIRTVVGKGVDLAAPRRPHRSLPLPASDLYGSSIHRSRHGEWDFNLDWKPLTSTPIRFGWLAAIRRAQARLAVNLGLSLPILVLCSTRSVRARQWSDEFQRGDAVLNADRIADLSTRLGTHVTCVRIADGMHDLVLSRPAVREAVYAEIGSWLDRYDRA